MLKNEFVISKEEVKDFAKTILPSILEKRVLALTGDLGAGKTFFAGEIIKLITKNDNLNITSPTFNIVNIYNNASGKSIYHFDLYRLKNENELENIGFFEGLEEGLCIIEWPEIAKKFLKSAEFIEILNIGKNKRKFIIYGRG